MEVIILTHEQQIGSCQEEAGNDQVCPMCRYGVGAKVDESQRDGQLQGHIEQAHRQVAHAQFIRHQLVGVQALPQHPLRCLRPPAPLPLYPFKAGDVVVFQHFVYRIQQVVYIVPFASVSETGV